MIMFSSLLSLLWSVIPKRYPTNHQVLFFTFRHFWKTENKWNELKNGNNYCCNTSSELPLQFIQQIESYEVTSKRLVSLLQRPLAKKPIFCAVYYNTDHIQETSSTCAPETCCSMPAAAWSPQGSSSMGHSGQAHTAWLMGTAPAEGLRASLSEISKIFLSD